MDWDGVAAACGSVRGVAGSGELLETGHVQSPKSGGFSREDLLHSPPRECRATYLRIAHSIWISNHLAKTPYQTEAYPSVERNTLSPLTLSVSLNFYLGA
jgi:hypothetical protein